MLAPRVLRGDDHRRTVPGIRVLDQAKEPVLDHGLLGNDHDVRGVPLFPLAQDRCRREPPGVPAHDLQHRYGGSEAHRLHVAPDPHGGQGNESRGASVTRGVVGREQVVVDGLGHVDYRQSQPRATRRPREGEPVRGGVVAPDDETVAYPHRLDLLQRRLGLVRAELPPGRAKDASRCARDGVPAGGRDAPKLHEPALDETLDPPDRAEYPAERRAAGGSSDDPRKAPVQHRSASPGLHYQDVPGPVGHRGQ